MFSAPLPLAHTSLKGNEMKVDQDSNPLGSLKGVRIALGDSAARLRAAYHLLEEVTQSHYVWMCKSDRKRLRVVSATMLAEVSTLELLASVHLQTVTRLLHVHLGLPLPPPPPPFPDFLQTWPAEDRGDDDVPF